jgi:hypothetical protein
MKKIILFFALPLLCITLFPCFSNALGFEGIGGKVSLVMPEGNANNNIGLGVIADLGTILPQINALKGEISAEYWGDSYDVGYYEWSWSSISLNGTAKYHFPIGGNISPFAGGGLGLIISRWSSDYKADLGYEWGVITGDLSDSDIDIGAHLVGGADIPLGSNLKFVAEAKLSFGGTDTLQLSGGLVFKLK